jgi:hypothetical protein
MNDEISNDVKRAIIEQRLSEVKQAIYDRSVTCEARIIAGFSEEENKPIIMEIERLVRLRDAFNVKLAEIKDKFDITQSIYNCIIYLSITVPVF